MEMKSQLNAVVHQQQLILQELAKTRTKRAPQLPAGVMLPLQTFGQVQSLERKLETSADKHLKRDWYVSL